MPVRDDERDLPPSTARFGDHLSATTTRDGKLVGYGESANQDRAAHGDEVGGKLDFGIGGKPSHGEAGTFETGRLLVEALNAVGANWRDVRISENQKYVDVDAFQADDIENSNPLLIQVVRAIVDGKLWQSLAHDAEVRRSDMSPRAVAELIKDAISSKEDKVPPENPERSSTSSQRDRHTGCLLR